MVPTRGFQTDKGNCLRDFRSSKEREPRRGIFGGTGKDETGVEGRESQ